VTSRGSRGLGGSLFVAGSSDRIGFIDKAIVCGSIGGINFATFCSLKGATQKLIKDCPMRTVISALLAVSAMLAPLTAWAQSADATGKIADVSTAEQTIKLSDGKTYVAPAEFNFEGLDKNVEVVIFYTVVDGKRMINDLEVVQ